MPGDQNQILSDLAGAGQWAKATKRLVDVVALGVGGLYRPVGSILNAKADAKAAKIHAEANCDVSLMNAQTELAVRMLKGDFESERGHQLLDVTALERSRIGGMSPLAERTFERVMLQEYQRQRNLERVVQIARANVHEVIGDEEVRAEWVSRFFVAAQDASSVEMQALWGQVLAREVSHPGSFSLLTLNVVQNLTGQEARIFGQLCRGNIDGQCAPGPDWPYWARLGLGFEDFLRMRDHGLVSVDSQLGFFWDRTDLSDNVWEISVSGRQLVVPFIDRDTLVLPSPLVTLSLAGRELLAVARPQQDQTDLDSLVLYLEEHAICGTLK